MSRVVEVIAVGTELLLGQIANTNGQFLAQVLAEHGALHYFQVTVGDNRARLVATLRQALERSDMVVTIGGLGPTEDDLTKEAVAQVFGRTLVVDDPSWQRIVERMRGRGRPTPNNRRQAELPEGARAIPNAHGTAPGVLLEAEYPAQGGSVPRVVLCLPGPPNEFEPMVRGFVAEYLEAYCGSLGQRTVLLSRSLRLAGTGESQVAHDLHDLIVGGQNPTLATYAKPGDVEVRITARASSSAEAQELLLPVEEEVRRRLGRWIYGADHETLASAAIRDLLALGRTLAVAESCTGGLLSEWLTATPGASGAFTLGAVAYTPAAKTTLLGVDPRVLREHGAVSAEVAEAMATGARAAAGSTYGVGITGVAGPTGGSELTPVGTVFVAVAGPEGTTSERAQYGGDRALVRRRAAQQALVALRARLVSAQGLGTSPG